MEYTILICEDEKNIVSFLKTEILHAGYKADVAYDGDTALEMFSTYEYDLILLDLMLPKKSGIEVLQIIRKTSTVPVIILTARKDTFDKVLLLKSGADDYVTKPFDTMELLARIQRNLERTKEKNSYHFKELHINYDSFSASIKENTLNLTKTEFELLYYLLKNVNKVITREQMLTKLYGDFLGDSNVVDVNIKNIRKKLSEYSELSYIETVRGKGYVIRE